MRTPPLLLAALLLVCRPLSAQDLVERARALYDRGALDSAYALIQRAAEAEPNRAEAHYWLGQIAGSKAGAVGGLRALGIARRCKAGFARAVELEPGNVQYLSALAGYLTQAPGIAGGDRDSARVLAERVRQLEPSRGPFLLADVLRRGNSSEKARADSLVDAWGRGAAADRVAQIRVAGYWAQTDRPERALAVHERLLARDSTDPVARYGVARNLVALRRDPARALAHLRYTLSRPVPSADQPSYLPAGAWWRMGQAFAQLGQPDSARAMYERSLALQPDFRQARASLDSLRGR